MDSGGVWHMQLSYWFLGVIQQSRSADMKPSNFQGTTRTKIGRKWNHISPIGRALSHPLTASWRVRGARTFVVGSGDSICRIDRVSQTSQEP